MSRDGENLGPDLVCPRSGRRYRKTGPDQLEEIGDAGTRRIPNKHQ